MGHGDSSLIELITDEGEKKYVLIDTNIRVGTDSSISHPTIDFLEHKGVKKIDYFILSHLHRDHYSGIDRILQSIKIDKIIAPTILYDEQIQKIIFDLTDNNEKESFDFRFKHLATLIYYLKGTPQKQLRGKRISLFSKQFTNFEAIFYNTELKYQGEFENRKVDRDLLYDPIWHNYSIIGYLKFKNQYILFAGDVPLQKVVELMNIKKNTINILKAPHHGKIDASPIPTVYSILAQKSCVVISDDGSNNILLIKELEKNQIPFYSTNNSVNCLEHFLINTDYHNVIGFKINDGIQFPSECKIKS